MSTKDVAVPRPVVTLREAGKHEPSLKYVDHLASIIGPEVYDVLGLQRPDPLLSYVTSSLDDLTDTQKSAIREQIKTYLVENENKQPRNAHI